MSDHEAIKHIIMAIDTLNQQIGLNRLGGLDGANHVGDLLSAALAEIEEDS